MKKLLTTVSLLAIGVTLTAQNKSLSIGRLYGKIIEKQSQNPIAFASVTVYLTVNKKDSLIGGMLTKENGEFSVGDLPFGKVKIKMNSLGFKEFQQVVAIAPPENVEQDLGNIGLDVDAKVLKTVEISAEKNTMQLAIDRKVFNMDKNLHAQGGTAIDALKSVPSITIDGENTVLLRNQTPQIYIDGRPTPLSIQQIPADQIDQIEIITNPSTKFDASTTGGIINLVMKKNRQVGFSGNYALGAGTGNRYAVMSNLNFKKSPFNTSFFVNTNSFDIGTKGYTKRTNRKNGLATDFLNQNFDNTILVQLLSSRLTVDYALNNRNTITIMGAITLQKTGINELQYYDALNHNKERQLYGNCLSITDVLASDYVISTTWKKTFLKKGKELIANYNYNFGASKNNSDYLADDFKNDGSLMHSNPSKQRNRAIIDDIQTTFTLDYTLPINDSTKLETGVRSMWNGRNNLLNVDSFAYASALYKPIDYLSFNYNYDNFVNAAYVNILGKMKQGWAYQAGFRYEQSNFISKSKSDSKIFNYAYPNENFLKTLFPSLYLTKKVDKNTEWQLNFSRKIGRPGFSQLTPYANFADRNSLRRGNPELRPEFANLAEVNFNKIMGKYTVLSALYFKQVDDPIAMVAFLEPKDPNQLITTYVNGKRNRSVGLDNTLKISIGKTAELMTNLNIFNTHFSYQDYENNGWAWNGKSTLTAKVPKDVTLQLTGGYETPIIIPQGTRGGVYFADFSIRKDLWNKTGTLSLIVNDIFDSKRLKMSYDTPQYLWDASRRRDNRYVRITLQKRFGKLDASVFKPRKGGAKSVREQTTTED